MICNKIDLIKRYNVIRLYSDSGISQFTAVKTDHFDHVFVSELCILCTAAISHSHHSGLALNDIRIVVADDQKPSCSAEKQVGAQNTKKLS